MRGPRTAFGLLAVLPAAAFTPLLPAPHRRAVAPRGSRRPSTALAAASGAQPDVVVVGAGIGGLCAAATLADYGYKVTVLEAHTHPGGAAHGYTQRVKDVGSFEFDTGPSFFSGLSHEGGGGTNPLKDLLDVLGERVDCHVYNSFGLLLPEGDFKHTPSFKTDVLAKVSGNRAVQQWEALEGRMEPLAAAVVAMPAVALRGDAGVALTTARFLPGFATVPGGPLTATQMTTSFAQVLDRAGCTDPFARNWLDLLCFCLSGLPADGTITAEMAMMFGEFYKPTATMDYPLGGVKSIIDTLVGAIEKRGGEVRCNARVKRFVRDGAGGSAGRVVGVELERGGEVLSARKRVIVSNLGTLDTQRMLDQGGGGSGGGGGSSSSSKPAEAAWRAEQKATPMCDSFMHLHLGFKTEGLPQETVDELQCHYMYMKDWARGVDAEDNAVLMSIPSVADPSLAPDGYMVMHAYTPATERYNRWEGLERGTDEYEALKEERSQFLWQAIERVIPDIRERAVVQRVGTPLTHKRFLNVEKGSYGPAIRAPGSTFPMHGTPVDGLVLCGDATFPGIGVPAVAASGMIAANSALGLETVPKHLGLLDRLEAAAKA